MVVSLRDTDNLDKRCVRERVSIRHNGCCARAEESATYVGTPGAYTVLNFMRLRVCSLLLGLAGLVYPTTLEKLSIDEMSLKATAIVRGRVGACIGVTRGPVIYTRCAVAVSERWKGQTPATVDVLIPGGSSRGLSQSFSGTPKLAAGEEHVLFLWTGKSGLTQLIGLSQGLFDVKVDGKGRVSVSREGASAQMVDGRGQPVADEPVEMSLEALRQQVIRCLGGAPR